MKIALVISLLLAAACASVIERTSRGFTADIDGQTYYISTVKSPSQADAQAYCSEMGMQLVSLQTYEKDLIIRLFLIDVGLGLNGFWMSGMMVGDTWQWADGSDFTYDFWDSGYPSGEACCMVYGVGWRDRACDSEHYYICE